MAAAGCDDYASFHRWSVENRAEFWGQVIKDLELDFDTEPRTVLDESGGPSRPDWLPGAELNIAMSCLLQPADKTAIISGSDGALETTRLTYSELRKQAMAIASGLTARFQRGDAIALYMPMDADCVAAYLGVVLAGMCVVSIADSFAAAEVSKRLEIAGAKAIITVDKFLRGTKEIGMYDKVKGAGAPTAIVIPLNPADLPNLRPGDLHWADIQGDPDFTPATCAPYDVINVLFSSGTTGTPKAIPWTHLTPIKCAMDGRLHQDITKDDVVAWPTNIGWMMGPWLIFATLLNGATIALYEGAPTGAGFTNFIKEARVTVLGVVPALVRAWRASGCVEVNEWPQIRVFSSTGEPSSRENYLWLMATSGYRAPVIEYLGGTEIGGGHVTGTVVQPASPSTFTTPALGLDVLILDDDNRPVEEGQSGQMYLVPPSIGLSQSLLNRDHDSVYYDDCPSGPNGEILRRHGDEMTRLHAGYWRAQGRADDTMNLGGIKVSSLELERVLDSHEAVYESAAVAVQPSGEGPEHLVVFAVPAGDPNAEQLQKDLGKLISKEINPLFKIYDLVLTESLPRTASNKLMRRVLRKQYSDGV